MTRNNGHCTYRISLNFVFCAHFECSYVGTQARKMNRKGSAEKSEIYISRPVLFLP